MFWVRNANLIWWPGSCQVMQRYVHFLSVGLSVNALSLFMSKVTYLINSFDIIQSLNVGYVSTGVKEVFNFFQVGNEL